MGLIAAIQKLASCFEPQSEPNEPAVEPLPLIQSLDRRKFFKSMITAAGIVTASRILPDIDIDKLLWMPGEKIISAPYDPTPISLDKWYGVDLEFTESDLALKEAEIGFLNRDNHFITVDMITREALKVLADNLQVKGIGSYDQYIHQFAPLDAKIGHTTNVRKPPRYDKPPRFYRSRRA